MPDPRVARALVRRGLRRRAEVVRLVAGVGLLALAAWRCGGGEPARSTVASPTPFAVRELAAGVYAVPGDSGRGSEGRPNAGFIVTADGVVVVDALASPLQGERLVATIRRVSRQPIRWLVLTHHHPDHHFGAIVLRRAGARVLAHPNREIVAAAEGDSALVADWTRVVGAAEMRGFELADAPQVPVTADTTLVVGGRRMVLIHPRMPAHTPGDLAVWFPEERVLFAGDLLVEDGVTMVVDGDSGGLLASLERLDSLRARVAVPGHGRISRSPEDLIALTRRYVEDLRASMREAFDEGRSLNMILADLPPADEGRPVSRASRVRRNAVRVYLEMEREAMGLGSS